MSDVSLRAYIVPPGGTLVDPDITMRAKIPPSIDSSRYVATIDRAFSRTNGTHSAHIIAHTNGSLYAVWAEKGDVSIGGTNRAHLLLYFASSTDQGLTWSSPVQIFTPTSPAEMFFFPQLIQLTALTSSNMGLVFNWCSTNSANAVVQTAVIDQSGAVVTAKATLTTSTNELRPRVSAQNGGGFIILALNEASTGSGASLAARNSIRQWVTGGVFTGVWTTTTTTLTGVFIVDHDLTLLQNGDLLHLYSYVVSSDGDTTSNGIRANVNGDLGYRTWNSGGGSFGANVQLTTEYSAVSPGMRTSRTPLSVSVNETEANAIDVAYAEADSTSVVSSATATNWSATSASNSFTTGWPGLDLLATYVSGTNPGLYIVNFREAVITRLHTASTPALQSNSPTSADWSYDGKFLAVADSSGIRIFATNGSTNPADWTIWLTLTSGSTPALRTSNVQVVRFQPNSYKLWLGYGISGASMGAMINDISLGTGSTLTACSPTAVSTSCSVLNVEGSYAILLGSNTNLYIFNLDGSYRAAGLTAQSIFSNGLVWSNVSAGVDRYWSSNDTNSGVQTLTYDGATMVKDQVWTQSSTPAIFPSPGTTGGSTWFLIRCSGEVMAFQQSPTGTIAFFKTDKSMSVSFPGSVLDYSNPNPWPAGAGQMNSGWWDSILDVYYVQTTLAQFLRVPRRRGLIRRTSYPYATHALTTTGATPYQAMDSANSNINYYRNHFLVHATGGWQLYGIRQRDSMYLAGGFYIGNSTQTLQLRSRISVSRTETLQMRGRISVRRTSTLQMRAFLVISTRDIDMRGRVSPTIQMRSRLSRRQGWPIPNPVDPAAVLFQPTQLQLRGRVRPAAMSTQSIQAQGSIYTPATTHQAQMRAFLVSGQTLALRGRITPRTITHVVANYYQVNSTRFERATMLFYVRGNVEMQNISIGARIAKTRTATLTSHFVVYNAPALPSVIQFDFSATQSNLQTLTTRARVVRP